MWKTKCDSSFSIKWASFFASRDIERCASEISPFKSLPHPGCSDSSASPCRLIELFFLIAIIIPTILFHLFFNCNIEQSKGLLQHAVSTFCRMRFQFWIGKLLIKKQHIAVHFYLGYWKQPWFGPAGSENAYIFCMRRRGVATQLYEPYFYPLSPIVSLFLFVIYKAWKQLFVFKKYLLHLIYFSVYVVPLDQWFSTFFRWQDTFWEWKNGEISRIFKL